MTTSNQCITTDYRPSEEIAFTVDQKSNPNPKVSGTAEAYFVCHIGHNFQISSQNTEAYWLILFNDP